MITFIIIVLPILIFLFRILERKMNMVSIRLNAVILSNIKELRPLRAKECNDWYTLSWSGQDPLRVISLATSMALTMDTYEAGKHLASAFYSQVKHLVKKGRLPTAIVFWIESRNYAKQTLEQRASASLEERNPIDLEVLGAPEFLLAVKLPIVGSLVFKKPALEYLEAAEKELAVQEVKNPIEASLIWSKLYVLTKGNRYVGYVAAAGLTRDMDKNQMLRIAKHLGFKSLDELYVLCNI